MSKTLLLAAAALFVSGPLFGQQATQPAVQANTAPTVNERGARQQDRIASGVKPTS
jgi:hypothetical protein